VAVPFLIAAQAALQGSAHSRVDLRDNSPADAVQCIRHAASPVVRRRVPAPALASGRALALVPVSASVRVWAALLDSFHLQVRLHVRSVQAVRLVAAVRPTKRVKKAR
jgi:hypothetical protein